MHRNLPKPSDSYMIEGALTFQAGVHMLNGLALPVESLPLRGVHFGAEFSPESLMRPVHADDGMPLVLPLDQVKQRLPRVACVGYDKPRTEVAVCPPCVPQQMGGSSGIVHVTGTDISCDWQFVFTVHQQVRFVAIGVFRVPISALFYRPPSIRVGFLGFTTVRPGFDNGRVHRHSLSEPRQFGVAPAHQGPGNILHPGRSSIFGEFGKEAAEGGLVGDGFWAVNTTRLGDQGIIVQFPNQSVGAGQPHDVFGQNTMPQDFGGVPLGATADRPNEGFQKGFIIQLGKYGLKLPDNRRRLWWCASGDNMSGDHGKPIPSCWLGDSGVDSAWVSVFIRTSVLRFLSIVNEIRRTFAANSQRVSTIHVTRLSKSKQLQLNAGSVCRFSSPLTAGSGLQYNVDSPWNTSIGWRAAGDWPLKLGPSGFLLPSNKKAQGMAPWAFLDHNGSFQATKRTKSCDDNVYSMFSSLHARNYKADLQPCQQP